MNLQDTTLALCFSQGVSLEEWRRKGLFDREVQIYNRVAPELKSVQLHTFGSPDESSDTDGLHPKIRIHPNRLRLLKKASRRVANPLPALSRSALKHADIVKTNQISAAPLAAWAKERYGLKMITRCGYLWSYMAEKDGISGGAFDAVMIRERTAFRTGDLCVVPTDDIKRMVVERHDIEEHKIRVIPNYVDTDVFRPMPEVTREPGLILFVGRLEPQKNLPALMDALAEANAHLSSHGKQERYRLEIVGEGSEKAELQRRAEGSGVSVKFLGHVPNHQLPEIMNRAEAFVLVSNFEGFPKTSIEAMACGLPVIGTDISGTRDQIVHGKSGYLCGTDVASITHALLEVMGDAKMREALGKAARRHVQDTLSLDRTIERELEIYRELLET